MQNKPKFDTQYEAIDYYTKQRDSYIKEARKREDILLQKEKEEVNYKCNSKSSPNITNSFVKNENADNRLYYFRFSFKNKLYYKIGITSRTLEERYRGDFSKIDKILYNEKIDGAIKAEKMIKEKFKDDIFPLAYLNNGGHTETFDKDVLGLDID